MLQKIKVFAYDQNLLFIEWQNVKAVSEFSKRNTTITYFL